MTLYHQVSVTMVFEREYGEDELWPMLNQLGNHSPAAQLHRARGWEEQGLESHEDWDAGRYTAAEITVGTEARDGEDLYDAGRRLTGEVMEAFPDASVDRVELTSTSLGAPENIGWVAD